MKTLIMFLIRKKLGLKKGERFQFCTQKSTVDRYYFTNDALMKEHFGKDGNYTRPSNIKLNYILSDYCKIKKFEGFNWC